jgi:uncharacterized protein YjdB
MRTNTILRLPLLVLPVILWGCSGDSTAPIVPIQEPDAPQPAAIMLAPSALTLAEGAAGLMAVSVHDERGALINNLTISWSSSNPDVAAVDGRGLVTALHMGTAEITAALGSLSAIGSVRVTPAPEDLLYVGGSGQEGLVSAVMPDSLVVRVLDRFGDAVEGIAISFTSTSGESTISPAPVVTDADGYAYASWKLGAVAGKYAVAARAANVAATIEFLAMAQPGAAASLTISADSIGLPRLGDTARLETVTRDAAGNVVETDITWTTLNPAVATVSGTGVIEAIGAGMTHIIAESGELSATAMVVVERQVATVVVSPSSADLFTGDRLELEVTAFDAAGVEIERTEFRWRSSNLAVASVNASGEVTARAPGTAEIRVGLEGASDTIVVVVRGLGL